RLQRRVRDLCAQLEAAGAPQALHLNLQGGFGRLFGGEMGKALGALYGLERAAGARPLLVEDALPPAPENPAAWRELRRYLGFRQMRTRLLAGAGVCRAADVAALAAAEAVDGVHLRLAGMAGLDAGIQAVLTAREHGLMVLLSGSNPDTLAHVALAAQVNGVGVTGERPFAAQIEMQRAAAWLRHTSA
ncbi:MAG: hypothetical protein KC425_23870, partial [Anaerolineales bacterium]|nr:hypothetical protein [Anaerolineales bacterium]